MKSGVKKYFKNNLIKVLTESKMSLSLYYQTTTAKASHSLLKLKIMTHQKRIFQAVANVIGSENATKAMNAYYEQACYCFGSHSFSCADFVLSCFENDLLDETGEGFTYINGVPTLSK